jgi:hypothetical protein
MLHTISEGDAVNTCTALLVTGRAVFLLWKHGRSIRGEFQAMTLVLQQVFSV